MEETSRDATRRFLQEWHRGYPERKIAGVCAAVAAQLGVPLTVVRAVFLLAALPTFSGLGLVLYLILWLITPPEPGGASGLDRVVAIVDEFLADLRGRRDHDLDSDDD